MCVLQFQFVSRFLHKSTELHFLPPMPQDKSNTFTHFTIITNNTTSSSDSPLQIPKQMSSSKQKTPRNPLSNLTNTIPNATSSSSSSTPTIKPISKTPLSKNKSAQVTNLNENAVSDSPNPRTPSVTGDGGRRIPVSVYTSRKRSAKSKLNEEYVFVNPDLHRGIVYKSEVKGGVNESEVRGGVNESEVVVQTKSTVKPPKKKKRKTSSADNVPSCSLPQDYIEKQRAYFAEIDAFELSEEEASADDLE